MMELLAKIMAQVLSALALSTKVMKQKRISVSILFIHPLLADYDTEKIVKRLAGRTDVEDALQRLDALTNEEALMTAARNLEVVDHVDETATRVGNNMTDIRLNVRSINNTVKDNTRSA